MDVTKPPFPADLDTFTEEILNGFLCSVEPQDLETSCSKPFDPRL